MKKLLIIVGFVAAVLAIVLSATPLFKISIFPAVLALLIGLALIYISKKQETSKKVISLIFLLTIASLSITVYNSIFEKTEVGNTQEIEALEKKSEEEAIEELDDLDIEL